MCSGADSSAWPAGSSLTLQGRLLPFCPIPRLRTSLLSGSDFMHVGRVRLEQGSKLAQEEGLWIPGGLNTTSSFMYPWPEARAKEARILVNHSRASEKAPPRKEGRPSPKLLQGKADNSGSGLRLRKCLPSYWAFCQATGWGEQVLSEWFLSSCGLWGGWQVRTRSRSPRILCRADLLSFFCSQVT